MSKLKGAMIGFGMVAQNGHWPAYAESPDAEIVAIVDSSVERQKAAQALNPEIHCYSFVEDLLKGEKLDFVDICTPPSSHVKLAQACIQQGLHVLCEKPLSLHAGDYHLLAKHVQKSDKTVFTVHNWKYAPIYEKAFEWIDQGRIGQVWHVEIFTLRDSHCKGAALGAAQGSAQPAEDWRKNRDVAGGGILVDHGWHAFYLLLNLVGAQPTSVVAKMHTDPEVSNALEDAVQTIIQFPEADGYIHLTWKAKMRRNSAIVHGQNGTLLIDDDRLLLTTHDGHREEITFESALSAGSHHADWFKRMLPDFIEEIKNPAERGKNFKEAGWCVGLMCAAYESNLRGFQEVAVTLPGTPKEAPALA